MNTPHNHKSNHTDTKPKADAKPAVKPEVAKAAVNTSKPVTNGKSAVEVHKNVSLADLKAEEAALAAKEKEDAKLAAAAKREEAAKAKAEAREKAQAEAAAKRETALKAKQAEREEAAKLKGEERAKKAAERQAEAAKAREEKQKETAGQREAQKAEREEKRAAELKVKAGEREKAKAAAIEAREKQKVERQAEVAKKRDELKASRKAEAEARQKALAERKATTHAKDGARRPKATHVKLRANGLSQPQEHSIRGKTLAHMRANYKVGELIDIAKLAEECKPILYGLNVRSMLNKLDEVGHVDFITVEADPAPESKKADAK